MEEEAEEEEEEPCLEEAAEEEEQQPPQQPSEQQQPPQQEPWPAVTPGSLGAASRIPLQRPSLLPRSRSERLPSSQGGFEEGDDSIVPSTPTLFVPRRGDGFAEAVR